MNWLEIQTKIHDVKYTAEQQCEACIVMSNVFLVLAILFVVVVKF